MHVGNGLWLVRPVLLDGDIQVPLEMMAQFWTSFDKAKRWNYLTTQ